ncbi:MAG: MerR family transcriptional regulator [Oscillospiraceae bacterium]|nr:MerR family transcriptional regulator [Oscillospiraceae bacterium]
MKKYRTAEIATMIGVHPNTVRFYEAQGLLPQIPRRKNGYRMYSEHHLFQLRLIRLAFRAEILSDNLRGEVVDIIKTSAELMFEQAIEKAIAYQKHISREIRRAREAIDLTEQIIKGHAVATDSNSIVGRQEAAAKIGVSIDILRDWERNGLIQIPRMGKRRQYGVGEINRLKIISILRHAHYSQMSIRRMLQKVECGETDLLSCLDNPESTEDIVSVADRYITSLTGALQDTEEMLLLLKQMKLHHM